MLPAMLNRRSLLKKGLLGGAVLGVAGAAIALRPVKKSGSTPALVSLSEGSFWTLVAVAATVVPAAPYPVALASGVDLALAAIPIEARKDVDVLLQLLENGLTGLLFNGTPTPFSARDAIAREASFREWSQSRLVLRRSGYQALRKLCLGTYYSAENTWAGIGYSGPPSTGGLFYDDSRAGYRP